jgi:hypothetical protein
VKMKHEQTRATIEYERIRRRMMSSRECGFLTYYHNSAQRPEAAGAIGSREEPFHFPGPESVNAAQMRGCFLLFMLGLELDITLRRTNRRGQTFTINVV